MAVPQNVIVTPAMPAQPPQSASTTTSSGPTISALPSPPAVIRSEFEGLLEYIERSVDEDEDFHFLRFESLQRTNIVALQLKLVRIKDALRTNSAVSDTDIEHLRTTLEQYATAIQNYHFFRDRKSLAREDARKRKRLLQRYFQSHVTDVSVFNSHYSYFDAAESKIDALRMALMKRLPVWLTYSRDERAARKNEFREGKPPKEVSIFIDRTCRFIIAAIGGLFLVGPMLIMAIGPSTRKSLVTVSAAVLLFATVLTFGVKVSNIEALVSTATYAAVLIVFVGSSAGSMEVVRPDGNATLL